MQFRHTPFPEPLPGPPCPLQVSDCHPLAAPKCPPCWRTSLQSPETMASSWPHTLGGSVPVPLSGALLSPESAWGFLAGRGALSLASPPLSSWVLVSNNVPVRERCQPDLHLSLGPTYPSLSSVAAVSLTVYPESTGHAIPRFSPSGYGSSPKPLPQLQRCCAISGLLGYVRGHDEDGVLAVDGLAFSICQPALGRSSNCMVREW